MTKRLYAVTLLVGTVGCQEPTGPTERPTSNVSSTAAGWTLETTMPRQRLNSKAATASNIIYIIGGGSRAVDAYNPITKAWSAKQGLPEPLSPHGATNINGKIYVAGGFYGSVNKRTLFVYTPSTNTWMRRADMPEVLGRGTLHQGTINGLLYVYGLTLRSDGWYGPHRFFRYNPATNVWSTVTPPSYSRYGAVSGVINGRLYLVGGRLIDASRGWVRGYAYDVHSYTPGTGWTKRPIGINVLYGASYATLGGKLYMVGVLDAGEGCVENGSAIFDPASFTVSGFFPQAPMRYLSLGVAAVGKFFLMGGQEYTASDGYSCYTSPTATSSVLAYIP